VAPEEDAQAQEAQASEARAPQAQVAERCDRRVDRTFRFIAAAASSIELRRRRFFLSSSRARRFLCEVRGESAPTSRSFELHRLDFFALIP
jgi:hypothetical protein